MRSKSGQFDFVWIFALIVGAMILVLAVYGAMKFGDSTRYQSDSEIAKTLSVITDPLQAGFADGSFGTILFKQESRIHNDCSTISFGTNRISVQTRSGIGNEWNPPGVSTSIHNKYIFSSEINSGKTFYVFSKSFEFPYKFADLIFLTSDNYCFVNAPDYVDDEINKMNMPNIKLDPCENENVVRVCFDSGTSDCDVKVTGANSGVGTVKKNGTTMEFVDNLMYAAIFSDKLIYDCNVERLAFRGSKIAQCFVEKTEFMNPRGCNTNMKSDLISFSFGLDAGDLISLKSEAEEMGRKNDRELCGIW